MKSKNRDFWNRVRGRRDGYSGATRREKPRAGPKNHISRARILFEAQGWRPVSKAEVAEARLLFRRIRAARRAGSDSPYHSKAEFAAGIYALEMAWAYQSCCTSRIEVGAVGVPAGSDSDSVLVQNYTTQNGADGGWATAYGPIRPGVSWIASNEWHGYHIEKPYPGAEISTEDREMCARILAKSPGRPVGRPPIGDRAMTIPERKRRQREKLRVITASTPPAPSGGEHVHVGKKHQRNPRSLEGGSSDAKRKRAG